MLELSETGVAILTRAGFTPDEAARAWHLILAFACSRPPASPQRAARSALAGLPEDDFPALAAASDAYAEALGDDARAFQYGLETVLDGLEQRLAAPTA